MHSKLLLSSSSSPLRLLSWLCCCFVTYLAVVVPVGTVQGANLRSPNVVATDGNGPSRLSHSNRILPGKATTTITFSEFPVNTTITNQYASSYNVVFGPDQAVVAPLVGFIPGNTQALTGFPLFQGPISGYFVNGTTGKAIVVKSFTFSIGYFDKIQTARVIWYDPKGTVLGRTTNSFIGIGDITCKGGNIASFQISSVAPPQNSTGNTISGFAIDNFYSVSYSSSIVFRELKNESKDNSWGSNNLYLPGFDHVALSYMGSVYESHPGYSAGTYVSADQLESRTLSAINGVQNQHSLQTFKYNALNGTASPVIDFQEIPIEEEQAVAMRNTISSKLGAGFLGFNTTDDFVTSLTPDAQKGWNNWFTGCGLIEWAAEQGGVNGGQGFFPNALESISTANGTYAMLSPQMLHYVLQNQEMVFTAKQTIKGYFDPVNYVVTDPVGRRTGVVNVTRYNEIPNTNFQKESTPGDVEHLIINNPVPGEYKMKVYGIPGKKGVAVMEVSGRPAVSVRTTGEASYEEATVQLPVVSGSRGDVNGDGKINQADLTLLKQRIVVYVGGFSNTGDMNGDGSLDQVDVDLLTLYLGKLNTTTPTVSPTTPPNPTKNKCSTCGSRGILFQRYTFYRQTSSNRCTERCMIRLFANLRNWKCGKCP